MQLIITIDCDNAAFADNPREAADILEDLANRLPDGIDGSCQLGLYDSNGNHVGKCWLADEADAEAKMFAAAPELLAALQTCAETLDSVSNLFGAQTQGTDADTLKARTAAYAAIAKATA